MQPLAGVARVQVAEHAEPEVQVVWVWWQQAGDGLEEQPSAQVVSPRIFDLLALAQLGLEQVALGQVPLASAQLALAQQELPREQLAWEQVFLQQAWPQQAWPRQAWSPQLVWKKALPLACVAVAMGQTCQEQRATT